MAKYEQLVDQIRDQIQNEVWQVGDKLPSLRKQTELSNMSLMTVMQAYQVLESQGWISSHARSGYFVAPKVTSSTPKASKTAIESSENIDINDFIFEVLQESRKPHVVSFGSVYPDTGVHPRNQLNKALASVTRTMPTSSALYNFPPGNDQLRQIIAKRYAAQGMNISPDEIVITAGALDALNLSLQSVTKPGDWVVIESPGFYGALQALQRLNLRALSIRTDPSEGIDLQALETALENYPVKACWLMTNSQNPTGCTMPEEKKQQLVSLLEKHDVYLIEDDVYAELHFSDKKPLPAKAFSKAGKVMHCSSFSKTLLSGFRIGWVAAGEMAIPVQKLQLMSALSVSTPIQQAFAEYLSTRNYENHLRKMRRVLEQNKFAIWQEARNCFPEQVDIHYLDGGYFLWVELPDHLDAAELYRLAIKENISIAPGKMFSLNQRFNNCFRMNASFECGDREKQAIRRLAELIYKMI
ncbi:aminotransferase-like domain-containing protein [Vibrio sp. SCSIO 43137]|uniref:aminotransferase-like domain-containing protein n=1 Tax=Vibrio sp. SCSIO 43137 TaxID=3021011 RepID=UPI002307B196|nr:PLP-dependent aminotransferase family protein [Vibrio sp. SCSIO 43137]WCE31751.1 PLP-dependent aminotransferase family protein [Vibrio sp. SCSIO 43137]